MYKIEDRYVKDLHGEERKEEAEIINKTVKPTYKPPKLGHVTVHT